MGVNIALAKLRKERYHTVSCTSCRRNVTQLKQYTLCKRCRDLQGMTSPKERIKYRRDRCASCRSIVTLREGFKLCSPCLSHKAKEVLRTGRPLEERLPDAPFHYRDDIDPVVYKPTPRPTHMRALDWVDSQSLPFLFLFWGMLLGAFYLAR